MLSFLQCFFPLCQIPSSYTVWCPSVLVFNFCPIDLHIYFVTVQYCFYYYSFIIYVSFSLQQTEITVENHSWTQHRGHWIVSQIHLYLHVTHSSLHDGSGKIVNRVRGSVRARNQEVFCVTASLINGSIIKTWTMTISITC